MEFAICIWIKLFLKSKRRHLIIDVGKNTRLSLQGCSRSEVSELGELNKRVAYVNHLIIATTTKNDSFIQEGKKERKTGVHFLMNHFTCGLLLLKLYSYKHNLLNYIIWNEQFIISCWCFNFGFCFVLVFKNSRPFSFFLA